MTTMTSGHALLSSGPLTQAVYLPHDNVDVVIGSELSSLRTDTVNICIRNLNELTQTRGGRHAPLAWFNVLDGSLSQALRKRRDVRDELMGTLNRSLETVLQTRGGWGGGEVGRVGAKRE